MNLNPSEIRILVNAITKRTGPPVYDEDLEQEAALNAVEALRRIGHVRHPRALLMKIVRDTVHDHWRRRRRFAEDLASIGERWISQPASFETSLDSERLVAMLRNAVDRLPESTRKLLELFYAEDLSVIDIARLQNRKPSAVKMELCRARRTLRHLLRSMATKKSR